MAAFELVNRAHPLAPAVFQGTINLHLHDLLPQVLDDTSVCDHRVVFPAVPVGTFSRSRAQMVYAVLAVVGAAASHLTRISQQALAQDAGVLLLRDGGAETKLHAGRLSLNSIPRSGLESELEPVFLAGRQGEPGQCRQLRNGERKLGSHCCMGLVTS